MMRDINTYMSKYMLERESSWKSTQLGDCLQMLIMFVELKIMKILKTGRSGVCWYKGSPTENEFDICMQASWLGLFEPSLLLF